MEPRFGLQVFFLLLSSIFFGAESKCKKGCDLALGSYYIWEDLDINLTYITQIMQSQILNDPNEIVSYNKVQLPNKDYFQSTMRVNVPFPCDCINGEYLGHVFEYPLQSGDTYTSVANHSYSNLVNDSWLQSSNGCPPTNIPDSGTLNVTVSCSCGNSEVSKEYGLFITYPLRSEDTLKSIANKTNLDAGLLQRYNPGVDFSKGSGLVYIPGKDLNGSYVPLPPSTRGLAGGGIVGISVGVVAVVLLLAVGFYVGYYRKKVHEEKFLSAESKAYSARVRKVSNQWKDHGFRLRKKLD